jgi:broad specificity phosphatase PhoE
VPRADTDDGAGPERPATDAPPATAPTVVLLVRHGTTTTTGKELPGRSPGLHLADSGARQAEDVARRIVALTAPRQDEKPDDTPDAAATAAPGEATPGPPGGEQASPEDRGVAAVYASPLDRTRETAAPIAAAVGCEVVVDEGLIELDVGDWTGIALAEAAKRPEWKTIQRYPSGFTFPGGESFVAMQARMVATLDGYRRRHPGQTIVAVSHADPIRALVAHAMGTHLDLFQRVVVSPCSLTAIALGDGGPVVLTVNATGDPGPLVPS